MQENIYHVPVLLNETVDFLLGNYRGESNAVYVDATFGGGGYSKHILDTTNRKAQVIAIDRDVNVFTYAKNIIDQYRDCLKVVNGNFANIITILDQNGVKSIDGIVLDLGLSTYQLEYENGFSYMRDTELDMRADRETNVRAADVLNKYDRESLCEVFRDYGELRNYRKITTLIIESRVRKRFETTGDVVKLFNKRIPKRFLNSELSRIFQAIRIEVNGELDNLRRCLEDAADILKPGGRIAVVSYHSLEDRIVKHFFRDSGSLEILTKKPVKAGEEEKQINPRSRSAKLRAARKIDEE